LLIWNLLENTARQYPHRVALIAGDTTVSYQRLAETVCKLAQGLTNIGLSPGDRLAVLLPNSIEAVTVLLAANLARLIVVPLLRFYVSEQNAYILSHSTPKALVTTPKLIEQIPDGAFREIPVIIAVYGAIPGALDYNSLMTNRRIASFMSSGDGADPISILTYTSGTTGYPKGAAHTQKRLVNRSELLVKTISLTNNDTTIATLDIGRPVMLVSGLLAMFRVGGCVALMGHPDLDLFWAVFNKTKPSYCFVIPGYANEILAHAAAATADYSRLRFWISGGDKPSQQLHQQILQITGRPLLDMFGSTETGFLSINPSGGAMKIGSIGKPMQGVEMKLVDSDGYSVPIGQVGRLLVRTPNMMVGYWREAPLAEDAWFDMQDLLKVDEDGYFWFVDRSADVVVRYSRNVASFLVVENLTRYPGIADAIVVGIPDSRVGQLPVAFYRLASNAAEPAPDALQSWLARSVDELSIPVAFYRIEQWPLTSQGKVDRKQLIRLAESQTSLTAN